MRHNFTKKTLSRKAAPRKALLRNLATSLVLYEQMNTTLAKARVLRPMIEKLITIGRKKTLASRRQLLGVLTIESAVNKVMEELGPRYVGRPGGYTRIIKLGRRQHDGAEIAQIQFVND